MVSQNSMVIAIKPIFSRKFQSCFLQNLGEQNLDENRRYPT
jgi:hypothetical protein